MKQFRRILSLLLAAVMAMSILAACGNTIEDGQVNGTPATDPVPQVTDPTVTDPVPQITEPVSTEPLVTEPPATEPPATVTTTEPTIVSDPTKKPDDGSFTVEDLSATMYASDSVNVRSGPNADYKRIGGLKKNEAVKVTGRASTGWYRVDFKGEVGYVSNSYLTDKKPSEVVTTEEDDTGDVHIDENDNSSDDNSSGGSVNVNYGDWAKDNGWEYTLRHMNSDNYVNAVNAIAAGMQQLETSIFIDASYIPREEIPDFANLIAPIIAVEYCYVKKVTGFGTGQYDEGIIRVDVEYYVDNKADADKMVKELRSKADGVIGKLKSSWSDYQKIQYLHDWLVRNVTPDEDSYEGRDDLWAPSAYGAIVDGRATCLGYAKGMFYLLARAGYDTVFEVGKGKAAKHVWAKVRMDGKWYNIDPTWDDPLGPTAADPDLVYYDFFMVSDNYMTMSHMSVYNMYFYSVPSASSDSKCWHSVNGYYISSMDEASKILKQATKDAVNGGGKYEYVRLKFASIDLYDEFNDKYSKSYYNSSFLPDYTSKYTCTNKYTGTSKGYSTHSCSVTYRLAK